MTQRHRRWTRKGWFLAALKRRVKDAHHNAREYAYLERSLRTGEGKAWYVNCFLLAYLANLFYWPVVFFFQVLPCKIMGHDLEEIDPNPENGSSLLRCRRCPWARRVYY